MKAEIIKNHFRFHFFFEWRECSQTVSGLCFSTSAFDYVIVICIAPVHDQTNMFIVNFFYTKYFFISFRYLNLNVL